MGLRTTMGMTVKRKISAPTGNENSEILQPIAWSYFTDELLVQVKVHPRTCHEGRKEEQSPTLSLTSALDGVGGQRHAPAALPPGKTWYSLYRRLGGPQGQSGHMRKISPPTGIRSPDRPARSKSLYRLSYPGPLKSYADIHTNYIHLNETKIARF